MKGGNNLKGDLTKWIMISLTIIQIRIQIYHKFKQDK